MDTFETTARKADARPLGDGWQRMFIPVARRSARPVPRAGGAIERHPSRVGDADPETSALTEPRRAARGSATYFVVKRSFDVILSATLLAVLLPLLALIALAVRLDSSGSILYRARRVGRHGSSFDMLKFRTMIQDRRVRRAAPPPPTGDRRRVHKSVGDPRVTRLGRFLRRGSLDELPQLWNVLRGDMSLIGPRPEMPDIVARYDLWQHARHEVSPGITGWWQVNRDGTRLMHEATEFDLYYVEHMSWRLDLLILFRTVGVVLRGRGAY